MLLNNSYAQYADTVRPEGQPYALLADSTVLYGDVTYANNNKMYERAFKINDTLVRSRDVEYYQDNKAKYYRTGAGFAYQVIDGKINVFRNSNDFFNTRDDNTLQRLNIGRLKTVITYDKPGYEHLYEYYKLTKIGDRYNDGGSVALGIGLIISYSVLEIISANSLTLNANAKSDVANAGAVGLITLGSGIALITIGFNKYHQRGDLLYQAIEEYNNNKQ